MRLESIGDIPAGSKLDRRPHNRAFRLAARLIRRSYAGGLVEGAGGVLGPDDETMDAKITAAVGGGKYLFTRVQGRASGAWADDATYTGTCWEYQKNTTVAAGTYVTLNWIAAAAEWRFQTDKC